MSTAPDRIDSPLWVVTTVFNPVRFRSRWALYEAFAKRVRDAGAHLVTVEAALGERAFAIPAAAGDPSVLRCRLGDNQEIWLKENLQNLGVRTLPPEAKYVAFVDADVAFSRPDWVEATLHALQHYEVVQMFSTAIDLSPAYEPLAAARSFGYNVTTGSRGALDGKLYAGDLAGVQVYHPGFAWAWRMSALSQVGGLIERAITGPADHHMAWALIGRAEQTIHGGVSAAYRDLVMTWAAHAEGLEGNVGYVEGTLFHHWHGRKVARGYESRWQILIDNAYDPANDVRPDVRGVLQLAGNKPKLRDDLRRYFRSRSEDSIEVPEAEHKIVGPAPGWPAR